MIDNNQESYVIFASHMMKDKVKELLADNGVSFKELVGAYKGKQENSYIVNEKDMLKVVLTGIVDKEESLLLLKGMTKIGRPAELIYKANLKHEQIGFFKEVDKEYAEKQNAYTYDPLNNIYYVAEHVDNIKSIGERNN